jgi:hypothetical protein
MQRLLQKEMMDMKMIEAERRRLEHLSQIKLKAKPKEPKKKVAENESKFC